MELHTLWFCLVAVLWIGYFTLEGFDFGVGMLLPVLAKNEKERRVLYNTIGPVWDGNEVWVLTAGGAIFASFPFWYATLFSGFFLPLLLILLALIVRNLAFDYRGKKDDAAWRRNWDIAATVGSFVPALLWGVAFANIVGGTPIEPLNGNPAEPFFLEYTGFPVLQLLNPLGLLGGLVTVTLFATHGAMFIALKTDGEIRHRAREFAVKSGLVAAVLAVAFLVWMQVKTGSVLSGVLFVLAAVALLAGIYMAKSGREGVAFSATFATIAFAVAGLFAALFPDVMPSSIDPAYSLTVANASATDNTLKVMTVVALIFTPLVLLYQGWTYWVFRKRISVHHIPDVDVPASVSA
jgi:cytochrome d ubiquinol oxidase subunit II